MANRTVRIYLLISVLFRCGGSLLSGVYVLFLRSNGLDLFELNLPNVCFALTLMAAEVPTGIVADVWGRKRSVLIACALAAIGHLIYATAGGLRGFLVAEVVLAVGLTFYSGAFEAWLCDTLKANGVTDVTQVIARDHKITSLVSVTSTLAGGWLATYSLRLPFIVSGVLHVVTGTVVLLLVHEHRRDSHEPRPRMCDVWRQGFHFIRSERAGWLILTLCVVMQLSTSVPNMQWQPLIESRIPSPAWYATTVSLAWLGAAAGAALAQCFACSWLRRETVVLGTCCVAAGAGIALTSQLGLAVAAVAAFVVHEVPRGMIAPISEGFVHRRAPSASRATVVSMQALGGHCAYGVGCLASGLVAREFSIGTSWLASAALLAAFGCWFSRQPAER